MQIKNIPISKIEPNEGQIKGLPKNPRFIKDERFKALVKSIEDDPEMLALRECIVYPNGMKFVVIAGNMRYRACVQLGYKDIPCKVLTKETPVEKLRAYTIKDNVSFGSEDWDLLANEWEEMELVGYGLELKDIEDLKEGEEIEFERSLQIEPPKEYIIIIADQNQFEEIKEKLKLKMVRRGGYKKGSMFDDVGIERVIEWNDFKKRYSGKKKNVNRRSVKK
ncbi:ParB N-terminal domain-containing protein [bacterium]|nr:ParB N-terminal domain-containing protein [bacterium]